MLKYTSYAAVPKTLVQYKILRFCLVWRLEAARLLRDVLLSRCEVQISLICAVAPSSPVHIPIAAWILFGT